MTLVRITGPHQRDYAHRLIAEAPLGHVMTLAEESRSKAQNRLMWDWLTDFSNAQPQGIQATKEQWKNIALVAFGREAKFIMGLDGQVVPDAMSTSAMGVKQMADFLTFMDALAAQEGVRLRKVPALMGVAL